MKLRVEYPTKERIYLNEHVFRTVYKEVELTPLKIYRTPDGWNGASRNRYHYSATFIAPEDSDFQMDGVMNCPIIRKWNPDFKPLTIPFDGRVYIVPTEGDA